MAVIRFINNPKALDLDGFRSITTITLSPYWIPQEATHNFVSRRQSFNYRRGESAIILLSRTQPLAAEDGESFRDSLISGPHALLVDEWSNLKPIVGDQVDQKLFALKSADVVDWNGKLVIVTEGTWADFGVRAHSLFIDAEDDGRFVEEVTYQAPASEYKEHLNEAMLALQSIEWKVHSRW